MRNGKLEGLVEEKAKDHFTRVKPFVVYVALCEGGAIGGLL
jgi:hypothetical protein